MRRELDRQIDLYSVYWISLFAVILYYKLFEQFEPMHYMALGLAVGPPCVIYTIFMQKGERHLHWMNRYATRANLWIAILAFVANYDWTHYFYQVLGAKYTFIAHRLNDVPICLYLITHSYFMLYHSLAARVFRYAGFYKPQFKNPLFVALLLIMSYFVAFMETWTIQKVRIDSC